MVSRSDRRRTEVNREGRAEVLAEHGTDGRCERTLRTSGREAGEPRPKGPSQGTATPGITFPRAEHQADNELHRGVPEARGDCKAFVGSKVMRPRGTYSLDYRRTG